MSRRNLQQRAIRSTARAWKIVRRRGSKVKFFPDLFERNKQAGSCPPSRPRAFVEDQGCFGIGSTPARAGRPYLAARQRADALVGKRLTVDISKHARTFFRIALRRRPQEGGTAKNAAGEQIHHAHRVAAVKGRALCSAADAQLRLLPEAS